MKITEFYAYIKALYEANSEIEVSFNGHESGYLMLKSIAGTTVLDIDYDINSKSMKEVLL